MNRPWLGALGVAAALVALVVGGCGDSATFNAETQYTPESLAGELVFRYKALDPARRNEPKAKPRPAAATKATPKSVGEANRDTRATSLDDVVRETLGKANLITGLPRAEVITRLADAVTQDTTLTEADRQTIAARLRSEEAAKPASMD